MSKKEKLLKKLYATPSPKDFSWDEVEALAGHYGFTLERTRGSHFVFEHASGIRLMLSRPHGSSGIKHYQIDAIIEALRLVGIIQ
ncbi:MAG: type II toxin-antitoxin system HicA family toxin [Deltaproteobacteria bacterium]|nr:type II toxin-antitoxin system HicA family toxin [Deltaproteobacteria bacterium]